MKLFNLTAHEVIIERCYERIVIEPEEFPARRLSTTIVVGELEIDGGTVDLESTSFGEVENLPEEEEGVGYIVSRIVAEACPQRHDLYVRSGEVRDASGRVIACTGLTQIH